MNLQIQTNHREERRFPLEPLTFHIVCLNVRVGFLRGADLIEPIQKESHSIGEGIHDESYQSHAVHLLPSEKHPKLQYYQKLDTMVDRNKESSDSSHTQL